MKIVTFQSGYIIAETEEVEKHLYKLIEDDTLWEYISNLISDDLKNGGMASDRRLLSIEKMLHDIDSKLSAKQVIPVVQAPVPATTSEEASAKPVQPKKVKKTKVSGKGAKGFLAAAQKASSFR